MWQKFSYAGMLALGLVACLVVYGVEVSQVKYLNFVGTLKSSQNSKSAKHNKLLKADNLSHPRLTMHGCSG